MKLINNFVRIGLYVSVAVSLILSYFIWTNSTNRSIRTPNETVKSAEVSVKNAEEVYVPTKLFWHQPDVVQYTNREATIAELQKLMKDWQFGSVEKIGLTDEMTLLQLFQKSPMVELSLPQSLTIAEYQEIYQLKMEVTDEHKGQTFERLLLDLPQQEMYFVNTAGEKLAKVTMTANEEAVTNVLNNPDIAYVPVTLGHEILPYTYYLGEMELKQYSYIVTTIPYTTFMQVFFQESEEVAASELNDSEVNYTAGSDQLSLDPNIGHVNFYGTLPEAVTTSESSPLLQSFYYVGRLTNSYGKVRYFEKNQHQYLYRNYIEGFPVFAGAGQGSFTVSVTGGKVEFAGNNQAIQVPIPADKVVALPSTETVINDLLMAGVAAESLQDLQIGYAWLGVEGSSQVIDLAPKWYVKKEDQWFVVDDLVNQRSSEDGF